MSKRFQAHIYLFLVAVFYAVNYIVAKGIMPEYIGASGFVFYRVFGATVLFWIAHRFVSREKIRRDDYPAFILCALLGVAANQLLFFNGLNLTSRVNASVIMTINPILVLLASVIVLKEILTPQKALGVMLGLTGALLLIALPMFVGDLGWSQGNPWGDMMVLFNAASYGLYLVKLKPLMEKYEPLTVIKWVFTFACVMVFPFGYDEALEADWSAMPADILLGVAFVIFCVTFLVYLLNTVAMKTVSPSVVSAYIYLQPVLVAVISLALGLEKLNWLTIMAAALIFTGVYLVSLQRAQRTTNDLTN